MVSRYQKITLNNGLRLITIPMDRVASVTVLIMIGAGSRYESSRLNGISHFLEHMAFKGTKKRPTAFSISSIIDGIGGEFNAFTSKDHTGYFIKARVTHLRLLFDVLSDMLLNSLFREEEIEREKGVIIEEINLYEDTPAKKIGNLYENLLYQNHSLGFDIVGKAENIRTICREDFLSFIQDHYSPNNTVVVVAGGISKIQNSKFKIQNLAQHYLGNWGKRLVKKPAKINDRQKIPQLLVKYKKTNQAHLSLGVRAYPVSHPKRFALSVLASILGGGMSSRLFIEVRERRGLAYYVHSGSEQYIDVGYFTTTAGVDKERIKEAINVILNQYWGLREKSLKVDQKELKKAKEYIKGRLTLQLEDSQAVAGLYAGQEIIENQIRTPAEIMKKIESVTVDDVYEVAQEIFLPQKLNLAVIGPFREKEEFEKLLRV